MATYRVVTGSFSATPTKPSFTVDEEAGLHIMCSVERKNGLGAWGTWSTDYDVLDKAGNVLAHSSRSHSVAPWTDIDRAMDDFEISLGKRPAGTLAGEVVVSAHG